MRRFYPIRKGSPSAAAESRSPDASWSITIPCYEGPEGNGPGCLSLTNDAFARHVFVAGATGAGKSTLLRSILRQLIALGADNAARKSSILVFDFKDDDTTAFVQAAATAAGRKDDVEVLSLNSTVGYDFFRDCRSLADVTEYVQRLTFASGRVDSKDNFWDQYRDGLLHAALIWLVVAHSNRRDFSTWIQHAAGWLLSENGLPEEFRNDLAEFRERSEALPVGSADRIVTQQALRQIEEWDRGMDHRTRANAKSTLQLALRPLLEPAVLQIFGRAPERSFRIADAVEHGRILVLSVNAFLHPELAALIGRCAKADWYRAVFARRDCSRHATLVADEFHLCTTSGNARYDDCLALPLLRSRNAGVIAATQTLAGLDRAVGVVNRRVLLGNFGTLFFMRATESEIEEWAQQVCGSVDVEESEREEVQDTRSSGDLGERYMRRVTRRVQRPVCVPGALSRLETGQAYLLQEGGIPSRGPIWIAQDR